MKDLIIVGAGGLGREVLQMCMEINNISQRWNIKGFIDDNLKALEDKKCEYKVLGTISGWIPRSNEIFVMAIANPKIKKIIVETLKVKGALFDTIISPRAFIATTAQIGKGSIISPFCFVSDNVVLGQCVFFNAYTSIGHDTVMGDFSSTMGHVDITGCCIVGQETYWGSGARALPSSKIGDCAFVGAGSVVLRKVKAGDKVFGIPAMSIL